MGSTPGVATVTVSTATLSARFSLTNTSSGTIVKLAGDQQTANPGHVFANPLQVKVVDSSGAPLPGATVQFTTLAGSATVSPATQVTASNGQASVTVQAGPNAGIIEIQAQIAAAASQDAVDFDLSVVPAAATSIALADWNGANQNHVALTPGALMQVAFTPATAIQYTNYTCTAAPCPSLLQNLQILVGGNIAPIVNLATSSGGSSVTLTVQIPWETAAVTQAPIALWVDGAVTIAGPILVQPVEPALLLLSTANYPALHVSGRALPAGTMLTAGERVTIQVTGTGPFTPTASTNSSGLAGQVPANPPVIFLDGVGLEILSQSADPALPGVCDLLVAIPPGISSGNHALWAAVFATGALPASPSVPIPF